MDSSGLIEVWHRRRAQFAWTQTATLSGYPTVQVNANGSYPTTVLDKMGADGGTSSR